MAAWLVSRFVAMCVERCVLATWCWKTHCNGCVKVAWRRGVRNTIVFCSWELWIVLKWVHQGCESHLSIEVFNFALVIFLQIPLKKCFNIVIFFALAPRSHAVARSSIVFCNSIARYRIVMAASRLLGAAAAVFCSWESWIVFGVAASRLREWFVTRFSQLWRWWFSF